MKFTSVLLGALAATLASAKYSNTTITDIGTTVITVTSCESVTVCSEVPVTTGVTVVTTTIQGTVTVYTTFCPLPTETSVPTISIPEVETANVGAKAAFGLGSFFGAAGLLLL
ncbi:uncharacterized protein ASCRUDRAFT_106162 [Ascoidea rubescens DSM 1968]|uniref:Uncharacterized protein n=1 Tax=Ascoidea rubescens DSM 1968 TaxID=1344418 RepID=A0A1D2VSE3_9ASCO|nr:hypothetical protein ASCRUDRAFT_106162 [Ascoidea rubescens DSM 1968]ODV64542.1 hypothetical protein ASCRUDRAFT_106162 [Ascoidea rubescens DSM 1968]